MKIHRLASIFAVGVMAVAMLPAATSPVEATTLKPREFVTRDGSRLMVGDEPFRFAGTNIYWLGLDENVGGIAYPTYFRIADALDTAKAMGFTVVRSHMLASSGHELTLRPDGADGYNDEAFDTIDFAIAYAGKLGLRLMLPLTDEWEYYHGGHRDFTEPYGLPSEAFYTDERVIADYQDYVSHVMHHVNPLTGLALNEDPTVMAWEFGNELNGMTTEWIEQNAAQFREWAPNQLIAAGKQFGVDPAALAAEGVDIVDVHYYPPSVEQVRNDAATVAAVGKVFVAGEYGSVSAGPDLLKPLADDPNVTGMLAWSLFGHHDEHGFVQHDDGFTMHYPGDDVDMRQNVSAQVEFARLMSGHDATYHLKQPLITSVSKLGGFDVIAWRGTAGAAVYEVQRSERSAHGPWTTVHDDTLTDNDTPFIVVRSGRDNVRDQRVVRPDNRIWYRVVPFDRDGERGAASDPLRVPESQIVTVDPLETLQRASGHQGVDIFPGRDGAVVGPDGDGPSWVQWSAARLQAGRFVVASAVPNPHRLGLTVETSNDGEHWRNAKSRTRPLPGRERSFAITADLDSAAHVRLAWSHHSSARLKTATVWSADPAPVSGVPGHVGLIAPTDGATDLSLTPTLSWKTAEGAAYYDVVLSASADLGDPIASATKLTDTAFAPDMPLEPDTTYYWRVTAVNVHGSTASAVGSFTTRGLPTMAATIDDYESYASDAELSAAYPPNPGGDSITPTLAPRAAGNAMRLDFNLDSAGYAGVIHTLAEPMDLWGYQGLQLWLDATAARTTVTIQFVTAGAYWEVTLNDSDLAQPGQVRIPFDDFAPPPWASPGELNLSQFREVSVYVGGSGAGTLVVDDIVAYPQSP